MSTDLQKQEFGLAPTRQRELAAEYKPFLETANTHLAAAASIVVASEADIDGMKSARATRLALKEIRVDVEKTRKRLKEASLREGKAIDGFANIIKNVICPVEEELQAKEDIVRLAEERRKQQLAQSRAESLATYGVDCQHFDLANMAEEAFNTLLQSSEAGYRARIKAEQDERARIESERIAREKAEVDRREAERAERARIEDENRALREQAEADRQAREKAERSRLALEAKARKEREAAQEEARRIERERIAAERAELERREKEQAERLKLERDAAEARQKAIESEARQKSAEMENKRLAAMSHQATCPKCGHIFDADALK